MQKIGHLDKAIKEAEIALKKAEAERDKAVKAAGLSLGPHQVETLCDAWEKTGFELSAEDFLAEQIAAGKVS